MTETSGLPPQPPQYPPHAAPAPSGPSPWAQQPPRFQPPGPGTQTYPPPSEQYGPPPGSNPPPGWNRQPSAWTTARALTRSRDDRLIAGVAGGVGRSLGIDPLILRVLLVVLAFFGGAGVLLYALGWLLLDVEDGRGRSLIEDAFDSKTSNRGRNVLTVAALLLVIIVSTGWVLSGQLVPGLLLVFTVLALLLYARRDRPPETAGYGPGPWPSPYQGQPYQGQPYQGQPAGQGFQPPDPAASAPPQWAVPPSGPQPADDPTTDIPTAVNSGAEPDMSTQPTVAFSTGTEPTATLPVDAPSGAHRYDPAGTSYPWSAPAAPTGPMWSTTSVQQPPPTAGFDAPYGQPLGFGEPPGAPPGPPTGFRPGPPPKPPRQQREPSYLGLLTLSVMMIGLGVLAVVDVASADVPGSAYVALALGVVAAGLLVGTWIGRSRGLIVAGILLSVALVPTVVVDTATDDDWSRIGRWTEGETRRETPLSVGGIQPAYDVGSGRLVLDLRNVDFDGADIETSLTMGAGEVEVLLPPDVDVVADATVNLGELVLFGGNSGGVDVERHVTNLGSDGAGTNGDLDLLIDVNVGRAEVRR